MNRDQIRNPHLIYPGQMSISTGAAHIFALASRSASLYEKRFR